MVVEVHEYDVPPEKIEAYIKWAKGAIPRILAIPGVVEFRAYRGSAGASQIVTTCESVDMPAWAAAYSGEEYQNIIRELSGFAINHTMKLWGASPVVPKPLRPPKK